MRFSHALYLQALVLFASQPFANALSAAPSEAASRNLSILQSSLSSIAKKLTLSPEIIIPEPTDPTALLLQSTEITKMSEALRSKAKGNAAFVAGSMNALRAFCQEQERARGNFPGPLPVIYCESSIEENASMESIAEAGAAGVVCCVLDAAEIDSADDLKKDETLKASFESAREHGMQLIPEIILKSDREWGENDITAVVDSLVEQCGADPAAIILTVGTIATDDDDEEKDGEEEDCEEQTTASFGLPLISKELSKRIPILGSVRAKAGGGRMGDSVGSHKESGFNGCVLRCDCLPGYRMNPDLTFVSGFWGAAIGDLKSTKSKNFNFRSTVALERDIPMEWFNYQKNIMESGALGSPGSGGGGDALDADNGDYRGF